MFKTSRSKTSQDSGAWIPSLDAEYLRLLYFLQFQTSRNLKPINPRPPRPQRCRQWCVESVLCLHTFLHLEASKKATNVARWPGPPGDLPKSVRWDHDQKIDHGKYWKVGWIMMNRIFLVNSDHNRRMEDHWRILTAVFRIWNHQPMYTAEIAAPRHRTHFFPLRVLWADCAETAVGKTGSTHISVGGSKREHESFPLFSNNVFILFSYIGAGLNVKNGQLVETPTTTTIEIRSKTRYFSLKSWWKHTFSLFHTFSIYRAW